MIGQLLSLGRALLNNSKIVVCDEPTSNIDSKTDAAMQKILRDVFRDATLLTIAHRLDTIIDSDRIIVMDKGQLSGCDSPLELMNTNDVFRALVDCLDDSRRKELLKKATEAQSARKKVQVAT